MILIYLFTKKCFNLITTNDLIHVYLHLILFSRKKNDFWLIFIKTMIESNFIEKEMLILFTLK